MLSHISEKSDNVTLIDEAVHTQTSWICTSHEMGVVMLKGLKGSRRLFQFEEFAPLSLHLRQETEEAFKNIRYYRSDNSVAQILTYLRENRSQIGEPSVQLLLSTLRQIPMTTKTCSAVRAAYMALIDELLEETQEAQHVLASVVALAMTLISPDAFQGQLMERLSECLSHKDPRVSANSIEVFSVLYPQHQDRIFKTLAEGASTNRIRANLLVKDAKLGWGRLYCEALKGAY